jgi:hypothetical protein
MTRLCSLVPVSLVPKSLAATTSPPAFLTLASCVCVKVASLVLSFLALVKLVLTFLTSPPALISSLFSLDPISLTPASPALASPAPTSPAPAFLVPTALILHTPAPVKQTLYSIYFQSLRC